MRYSDLVEVYERLSSTTKKLEKVDILSEFLPKLKKHSEWIYLLRGRVLPDYDEGEFGISTQLAMRAISRSSGISLPRVVSLYRKKGDLGDVAEEFVGGKVQSSLVSSDLTVQKVFDNLKRLVITDGKGSVDRKLALVTELFTSAKCREAKYIVRTLLNDLRVGVADAILRDAIAETFFRTETGMKERVEEAYDKVNDFAVVYDKAAKGKKSLDKVEIIPGRPIKVMLPVKVTDVDEAFRICGDRVAVEHKYDGFRVLINKKDGKISLFTRRLDNVTSQFPDIVDVVKENVKGKSFILDSEFVGYDPKTEKFRPFEAISQRIKRKHNIGVLAKKLPVEINVFDIIYYNGESKMDLPFAKRRNLLKKNVNEKRWKIRLSKQIVTDSKKKVMEFYKDALKTGEEGVMIKNLISPYRPGRRVGYMVKMKPEQNDLDLVIVGAEYGTGKRAGGLTSFTLACKSGRQFMEVGRVSSGFKEKKEEGTTYKEMNDILQPLIIREKGNYVNVRPKVVVSVTYQNIQPSPRYGSGFALRFPRVTHYRPERGIYDVATLEDIRREVARTKNRTKAGLG